MVWATRVKTTNTQLAERLPWPPNDSYHLCVCNIHYDLVRAWLNEWPKLFLIWGTKFSAIFVKIASRRELIFGSCRENFNTKDWNFQRVREDLHLHPEKAIKFKSFDSLRTFLPCFKSRFLAISADFNRPASACVAICVAIRQATTQSSFTRVLRKIRI